MGRHRRSDAGRAATGRATGATETHGSYTDSHDPHDFAYDFSYEGDPPPLGTAPYLQAQSGPYPQTQSGPYIPAQRGPHDRSQEYLYATDDEYARNTGTMFLPEAGFASGDGPGNSAHRRRKKKAGTPVRTGLLGVSAAVAIGTAAVATGAVPGLQNLRIGGGTSSSGDNVQAADQPTNSATEQGGTSGSADTGAGSSVTAGSGTAGRTTSPSASPSASASTSASASPSKTATEKPSATPSKKPKKTKAPAAKKTSPAKKTTAPVTVSAEAAAEAEVLRLVNEQRAKVGCSAVAANSSLTTLAEKFSVAMDEQNFFDHTDPSGATPWDRASKLGISNLGGENIARGQADAAAVMDAWMNSAGHRANILNCDFKTLGVGVHYGSGGPWWTQDFGY
ncbi:CAP domain-containing protein [Streptomyces sp. YIM S03343]